MFLFKNDAIAFFNGMVLNIAILVTRKYGMEPNVVITRNLIVAEMDHAIHGAYWIPNNPALFYCSIRMPILT